MNAREEQRKVEEDRRDRYLSALEGFARSITSKHIIRKEGNKIEK